MELLFTFVSNGISTSQIAHGFLEAREIIVTFDKIVKKL